MAHSIFLCILPFLATEVTLAIPLLSDSILTVLLSSLTFLLVLHSCSTMTPGTLSQSVPDDFFLNGTCSCNSCAREVVVLGGGLISSSLSQLSLQPHRHIKAAYFYLQNMTFPFFYECWQPAPNILPASPAVFLPSHLKF